LLTSFTGFVPGRQFVGQRVRLRLMSQGFGYWPRESKNRQIQGDGVTIVAAQKDHVRPGEMLATVNESLFAKAEATLVWSASIEALRAIRPEALGTILRL